MTKIQKNKHDGFRILNLKILNLFRISSFEFRVSPEGGYAAITATIITVVVSLIIIGSFTSFPFQEVNVNRAFLKSVQLHYVAEGGIEDAMYRVVTGKQIGGSETLAVGSGTTTVSVTQSGSQKIIRSEGRRDVFGQNLETRIDVTTEGAQFHYGVLVGAGGIDMGNGAQINGNIFSNGTIDGGTITGSATVAAGSGNQIKDATIGVSARAPSFSGTKVGGVNCPNVNCVVASDTPGAMPIADDVIQGWRDGAVAGETINGNYEVSGTKSLGPKKINGDLIVKNGATLTITGTIWVTGTFSTENNSVVNLDSGYGINSGVIVVDSSVDILNGTTITGTGQTGSYVMIVAARNALTTQIMDISNNSAGAIYYAPHGRIHFNNNATAKEVTGYGFDMDNNATVTYESGLADVHFPSGPSGGYKIQVWKEVE